MKQGKILLILALLCLLGLGVFGCRGAQPQGWSGAVAYDGILYIGSMDGNIVAVNPSARSQGFSFPAEGEWACPVKFSGSRGQTACASAVAQGNIYGTPSVAEDFVYVGVCDSKTLEGKVFAINPLIRIRGIDFPAWTEGEWIYPPPQISGTKGAQFGAVVGTPVIAGDAVYVGTSEGKVYALDAEKGYCKWQFELEGKIWASPAAQDDIVCIGNFDGELCALSTQDGHLLWKFEAPAAIASSPVICDDCVFFGSFDCCLYAIDVDSGEEKWRFQGGNWFWTCPLVDGDTVYASCLDHKVYAIEVKTGKELWQFDAGDPIASAPVLVGDLLVVASQSGEVYVLKAGSGECERSISLGTPVLAPIYAREGIVYAHAKDDSLYAIRPQTGEIVWKFSLAKRGW